MRLFKKKEEMVLWRKAYSQDGEDLVLDAYYSDLPQYKGFYIDIGAFHPLRFSNTQLFYEKGWRGINIDATPGSMSKFNKIRPEDINLEYGISDLEGELTYYLFNEPALNNSDAERTDYLNTLGYKVVKEIKIKMLPINQILEKYLPQEKTIDFIDVDIEGLDFKVVKSLDFEKYAPKYFLVEELNYIDNDFMTYKNTEMFKFLTSKEYRVLAKTKRSVIYGKIS